MSQRKYCTKCGGHLMTSHPPIGLVDVFAATIPTMAFTPGVHVNYAETVLPMRDGLPKLKDFPTELGGSGDVIAEAASQGTGIRRHGRPGGKSPSPASLCR